MCGIFGTKSYKKLIKKYNKQRTRGYQGFGVLNVTKSGKIEIYRQTEEQDFIKDLTKIKDKGGKFCFVHHRFPTSTKNLKSQTHPIKVTDKKFEFDYYLMHNGVISNTNELKAKHDKLGIEYSSLLTYKTTMSSFMGKSTWYEYKWNDSNSLAVELARLIENQTEDLDTVKGTFAFIMVQVNKKTGKFHKVFVGRNSGNPLMIDDFGSFGSEIGTSTIIPGKLFELNVKNMELKEVKEFFDYYKPTIGFKTSNSYYSGGYKNRNTSPTTTFSKNDDDYIPTSQELDDKVTETIAQEKRMWQNYEDTIEDMKAYDDDIGDNRKLKEKINQLLDEYVTDGNIKHFINAQDLFDALEYTGKGDIENSNKNF